MHHNSALTDIIRRGRRRQIWLAAVTAISLGLALALAGAILLLFAGTEILSSYWVLLLALGGLAYGVYRERTRIPSSYAIAQQIDRQLDFHDALSTAHYFSRRGQGEAKKPEIIERQKQFAEELARSADVGRALPFRAPRTVYLNAALAVVACGMFGLRYGVERTLDLRPPLVRIAFDGFLGSRDIADAKKGQLPFNQDPRLDNGPAVDSQDSQSKNPNATDPALKAVENPDANSSDNAGDSKAKAKGSGAEHGDDPAASDGKQQPEDKADKGNSAGSKLSSDGNSDPGEQSGGAKNSNRSGSQGDSSSLADKLRDAFSNLLSKLKSQPKTSDGQQGNSQSANAQSGPRQNKTQDSAPQPANQEQAEANASGDSQGEQQQGGTQQPAQGKSQGNNNDHPNSPDGKNGIGNQDGDKTARDAAELAAMGKINEIIGKRAANLTGEVMVEVGSGKQQLKTQYSQTNATHVEAGGEINRDEIPLAYQQYVQQYFEQVRKLPSPKTKPADQ